MRRRTAVAVALATAAAAVWPDAASAHGLVGRADLPIPSWLFGWGASIVLIVSFVALATLWPQTLAWLCIGYAVVQLLAMAVFGVERWVDNGDGFTVYFNLFSRLSPLIRRDGVLHLRPPLAGVPSMPMVPGSIGLLCAAIGSTT